MSRSSWKIPYTFSNEKSRFCEKDQNKQKAKSTKIENRAAVVTPMFIGETVHIANGLYFVPVSITEGHVGFKFGAFALTKKRARLK